MGVLPRAAVLVALLAASPPCAAQTQPSPAAPPAPVAEPTPTPSTPTQSTPTGSTLPSDPERVRRALDRPSTLLRSVTKVEQFDTTFRVTVTQKPFNIWEYWGPPDTHVSSDVRTWYFSNWHAEYLRMVTPEAGRRAALYPQGMFPMLPSTTVEALVGAVKGAFRARAERQAKEEVRQALEDFFAAHPEARAPAPSAPEKSPPS